MSTIQVSDRSFETDVLQSGKPVLVDFWAEWCGPCKQIGPHLEALAVDMDDKITVAKLDVESNPLTASKYGVRGIPFLIVFIDGQVASTKIGSMEKSHLYDWVESVV